jgi:hypothetical protein
MAKSIRSALLANEVKNLAIFQAKGLIPETPVVANWKTELKALKQAEVKTSTVKVDSKLKPTKKSTTSVKPKSEKPTNAELAKYSKSRHEFSEIMSRQFGATKGYTLGDAIEHSASVYTSIVKQKRGQLEKLNEIGKVLQELRSVIGKSDKEFGQAVKATALKNMSRQDRSDAMWLSENWIDIKAKMKELDINSCSASYLRQLLRKEAKSTPTEGGDVSEANETDNDESTEGSSSVESSSVKLSGNDAESIASAVIHLAKLKGVSLAEIATLILAESAM